MLPILFELGDIKIYSHGVFLFLAMLTCASVLILEARRRKWPAGEAAPISLAAFVGGMIGARLSIVFFNGWETAPITLDFFKLFDPRIGPGSILGGVAGAYLGGFIASRSLGKGGCACDAFAPAMALAMVVGRIGCFLSGEDGLGTPTSLPWGVQLPGASETVHPTPIYDALFNLTWFFVLVSLRDHPRMQDGNLLKFGLGGYAVFRFFVEFLRTNRILYLGLTGQQIFCLGLIVVLILYFSVKRFQSLRIADA